ncbi:MAG: radical SAM protein [Methanomassiliicoccales archaeon]
MLTADRTLMSEYGGSIFLGFSAVIPEGLVPESVYYSLFCPPVEVNKDGSVPVAPCGTRKIESILLNGGFNRGDVVVAHPEHLDKVIGPDTKVVGFTENDPLGIGPATSTFTNIFGGDAFMKIKFREVLNHPSILRYRPNLIVGGPGAWQLTEMMVRKDLGITTVVLGEGEMVVPELFKKAVRGEALPGMVIGEVTPIDRIALLNGATVDGLVEISRGCGRGCDFCVPTMAKYRSRDVNDVLADVRVNIAAGRQPCLHAEDVVRYGAKRIEVDPKQLVGLFQAVSEVPGVTRMTVSHFALASVASAPDEIRKISEIMKVTEKEWMSGQTGIETGSPELMRRYMVGKCRPFEPDAWQETVVSGFEILERNHWIPCATLIMGLPGETERDVDMTLELLKKIDGYRSLIVPLFFVATGELSNSERSFTADQMSKAHTQLFLDCWEHNLRWSPAIVNDWATRSIHNPLVRPALKLILKFGITEGMEMIRMCRKDYGYDIQAFLDDGRKGNVKVLPMTVHAFGHMVGHNH